ncbi:hypothetical protein C7Q50_14215 [Staphylococcus aureus]|nr:hypothetical protein C7Q50_14215 [Staphylococcus aureus]
MKNIISIILGILMFLKLMELLYGAIFVSYPHLTLPTIRTVLFLVAAVSLTQLTSKHVVL